MGVDPGGTTGWCILSFDPKQPNVPPMLEISGQCPNWKIFHEGDEPPAAISAYVVEDFRLRAKEGPSLVGDQFIAPQVIGVVKFLAEKRNVPVILKPASDRVFFDSADEERGVGRKLLWLPFMPDSYRKHPHKWRHVLDAINHATHFIHFKLHIAYQ
jgi:hypothetical protein